MRRRMRRRILVTAFGNGSPAVKSTTWLRARMFEDDLAAHGIDLKVSGTVPAWVFPWGWFDGGAKGAAKRLYGLGTGAIKRLWQALILPYRYDAHVMLRDVYAFTGPPFFENLFARRANYFVFELDDALFLPPPDGKRPPLWTEKRAVTAASKANRVIAGNSWLAEWAQQYCDDVVVIPTTADISIEPSSAPREPGPIRVGWYGSIDGSHYLEPLLDAFAEAARRCDVEFAFLTDARIATAIDWPDEMRISVRQWDPATESDDLARFDIGIMPLHFDEWSKGKCGAKALHYMAAGIATIVTPVGVNCDIIEDGTSGLWASTPQDWTDAIVRLVTDDALRERVAAAGLERFEKVYSPHIIGETYRDAITPPDDVTRTPWPWQRAKRAAAAQAARNVAHA